MKYVYQVPKQKDYSKDRQCELPDCDEWFTPKEKKTRFCSQTCADRATRAMTLAREAAKP